MENKTLSSANQDRRFKTLFIRTGNLLNSAIKGYNTNNKFMAIMQGLKVLKSEPDLLTAYLTTKGLSLDVLIDGLMEGIKADKPITYQGIVQDTYPDYATRRQYIDDSLHIMGFKQDQPSTQVNVDNKILVVPSTLIDKYK